MHYCALLLFALCALYMFWIKQGLLALLFVFCFVWQAERLLNTIFRFTTLDEKDCLEICRGRFSKSIIIALDDIIHYEKIRKHWGLSTYILIEYGYQHYISVLPDNEKDFLKLLQRNQ